MKNRNPAAWMIVLSVFLTAQSACSYVKPVDPVTMSYILDTFDDALDSMNGHVPAELEVTDAVQQALMRGEDMSLVSMDEPRFQVDVEGASAKAFFTGLVKGTNYNIVVHPEVSGEITLSLSDVTIPETLNVLRDMYGFEYKKTLMGFEILPSGLQTRLYPLDYINMNRTGNSALEVSSGGFARSGGGNSNSSKVTSDVNQNIWQEVKTILEGFVQGEGRSVALSPQSGMIMVRAMPDEHRQIESYLNMTQKSINRQVVLEAKVLEVTLDDSYQHGINWGLLSSHYDVNLIGGGSTLGGTGTTSSTTTSNVGGNVGAISPNTSSRLVADTFKSFGGLFNIATYRGGFEAFLEFLNQQGNVQVLSSPRVSTLNNQKAIIKIGTDEYFVTDVGSNTSTASGSTTTSADVELTPFFSGIALDVTPFIDENDGVTLHVHPSITTVSESTKTVVLDGKNQQYPLAKSVLRESDSVIRAKSGQIIIIGGLMKHETVEVNTSVPVLGDIPYFGTAFRQTKQIKHKKELVILVRPTVVKNNDWSEILHEGREDFSKLDRPFHLGGRPGMFGHEAEFKRMP